MSKVDCYLNKDDKIPAIVANEIKRVFDLNNIPYEIDLGINPLLKKTNSQGNIRKSVLTDQTNKLKIVVAWINWQPSNTGTIFMVEVEEEH